MKNTDYYSLFGFIFVNKINCNIEWIMWKFHAALPNVVCYNKYKELQKAALSCSLFFLYQFCFRSTTMMISRCRLWNRAREREWWEIRYVVIRGDVDTIIKNMLIAMRTGQVGIFSHESQLKKKMFPWTECRRRAMQGTDSIFKWTSSMT